MFKKFAGLFTLLLITAVLSACGGKASDSGLSDSSLSGTIRYFAVGESGTSTSPWGDGSSAHRPAMAVKFTPASYPVTITSVTIYAKNNTGSDQFFNVYGYSQLATESLLFNPVLNQVLHDTGTSYSAITVGIPPRTISSGSFYMAVEWVTKPLSSVSGANAFFLRSDSQLDFPDTNFVRYASTWSSVESVNPTLGDLGIFVNYGTVATSANPAVVSAIPANGSTGVSRYLQEVAIQFDKEMAPGYSVSADASWPISETTPTRWSADQRTFYISRDNAATPLPAATTFHLTLNGAGHPLNFVDIFSNTLNPSTVTFTTGQ